MSFRKEAAATLRLGGPLIAAQLAQISINFIDTVMAGRLSARDLAAVAVGGNVWFAIYFFFIGLLLSINPTVSHLFGAGERAKVGHAVRQGLWLASGAGLCAFLVVRNARHLLGWFDLEPELIPITTGYLNAIAFGAPAACGFQVLRCYTEAISRTKPVLYASIFALMGNASLNYVFMYGKLGMPELGAVGCGVASAIVMWCMLAFMILYIKLHRAYAPFQAFSKLEPPHWPEIRSLIRLGWPIAISLFMEASLFSVIALLIGTMGTAAVAGHQIALNVASITFMVPLGIGMALSVRVGQAMGAGNVRGARTAGFAGIALAGAFMSLMGVFMILFPHWIVGIYTEDSAVSDIAVKLLLMAAFFQISDGLQVSGAAALRGMKDTRAPMVITFFAYWMLALPLGYLLGIHFGGGPQYMWVGIICGLTTAAVLLNWQFHRRTQTLLRSFHNET